jgi:hypothetical protein
MGIIERSKKQRACHKVCVNGHKVVEIPEEKTWSWHERKKRAFWIRSLIALISGD